jgi:hypothetical protein
MAYGVGAPSNWEWSPTQNVVFKRHKMMGMEIGDGHQLTIVIICYYDFDLSENGLYTPNLLPL